MRKASTGLLEQGIQAPSPAPNLIPAEPSTENLHWEWYIERGHSTPTLVLRDAAYLKAFSPEIIWSSTAETESRISSASDG
jgi:hypothetical protein